MADSRPTWQLVVEVASALSAGPGSFRLADIVQAVQYLDPSRARSSIQPVVQGMTINAGKGPQQPCGKVLVRTGHGWYQLHSPPTDTTTGETVAVRRQAPITKTARARVIVDVDQRVSDVIARFDELVADYDRAVPFRRSGQYELHRATIDRRRELGSAHAAIHDDEFATLLYETLQAWGIGRRASRLIPFGAFRERLAAVQDDVSALDANSIDSVGLNVASTAGALDKLIRRIGVVENKALIVAGTKTLHHLLPDLVPPMDRQWTGAFFGWWPVDPQDRQTVILAAAYRAFADIARATDPVRLVGSGWRTSTTKLLDNAVVAYCQQEGITPRGQG